MQSLFCFACLLSSTQASIPEGSPTLDMSHLTKRDDEMVSSLVVFFEEISRTLEDCEVIRDHKRFLTTLYDRDRSTTEIVEVHTTVWKEVEYWVGVAIDRMTKGSRSACPPVIFEAIAKFLKAVRLTRRRSTPCSMAETALGCALSLKFVAYRTHLPAMYCNLVQSWLNQFDSTFAATLGKLYNPVLCLNTLLEGFDASFGTFTFILFLFISCS